MLIYIVLDVNLYMPIFHRNQNNWRAVIIEDGSSTAIIESKMYDSVKRRDWALRLNRTYVKLHPLRRNIRQAFPLYHPHAKAAYTRTTSDYAWNTYIHAHINRYAFNRLCNMGCTYIHILHTESALLNIIYCNLNGGNTLINELPVKRILLVWHSRLCTFLFATTLVSAAGCRVVTDRANFRQNSNDKETSEL